MWTFRYIVIMVVSALFLLGLRHAPMTPDQAILHFQRMVQQNPGDAMAYYRLGDAYIQKAYDGYCTKIDWPFVRIIPKGWKPGT